LSKCSGPATKQLAERHLLHLELLTLILLRYADWIEEDMEGSGNVYDALAIMAKEIRRVDEYLFGPWNRKELSPDQDFLFLLSQDDRRGASAVAKAANLRKLDEKIQSGLGWNRLSKIYCRHTESEMCNCEENLRNDLRPIRKLKESYDLPLDVVEILATLPSLD